MNRHSAEQEKWYLRQHGEAVGPFPAIQIARYLLLQRLAEDDLISEDTLNWRPIRELSEVQPAYLEGLVALPEALRQQLAATRGWIQQHPEAFAPEPGQADPLLLDEQDYQPRLSMLQHLNSPRAYALAAVLGLAVVGLAFFLPQSIAPELPSCEAPAQPGVNWSNCLLHGSDLDSADLRGAVLRNALLGGSTLRGANLEGADLAYADLSLARLRGARLVEADMTGVNLRNADLQAANLQGADLRYANLTGVEWRGANLAGARLGFAVWSEEIVCMPESVGQCIPGRASR